MLDSVRDRGNRHHIRVLPAEDPAVKRLLLSATLFALPGGTEFSTFLYTTGGGSAEGRMPDRTGRGTPLAGVAQLRRSFVKALQATGVEQ